MKRYTLILLFIACFGTVFLSRDIARGALPASQSSHVYLPYVASGNLAGSTPTAGPQIGPISTVAPTTTPTPSATATPSGLLSVPIVFVSRGIPQNGSNYMNAAMDLVGVGSHSRFRVTAPGKLEILNPDGSLHVLIDGGNPTVASLNLVDVSAPAVSYDGKAILFAGVPAGTADPGVDGEPGAWRIYAINADGTNLRQITFSDQNLDLSQFGDRAASLKAYDDTDPAWLPDGRIVFSSTRWPEIAEYSGVRSTNLFVVNADGSNLHRITAEKNGADRPIVDPLTGKIVFSRWWRNDRFAVNDMSTIYYNGVDASQGYTQFNGLTINRQAQVGNQSRPDNLNRNFWQPASINPDGTGLTAWQMNFRDMDPNQYYGGAFTPSGQLYGNFFPMFNMSEAAGFGGIRLLHRGFGLYTAVAGVTTGARTDYVQANPPSFGVFPGPYFADPDVLPDGRLVVSRAPDTNQDYGLYVINSDGSGQTLLYDHPGTAEVGARVVIARPLPPIVPDSVTEVPSLLPPLAAGPYTQDGTFTFQDLNVYFNAPVDSPIVNAPAVGTASVIRFFLDHQRTGNGSVPQTDWPILLGTAPVNPDGSLINTAVPANLPLFEQIHEADGVTVPVTTDANGVNGAAHVAGMNYGRPGTTVQCVGCHAGHSLIPIPANPQFTNLAPSATVTVSSLGSVDLAGVVPSARAINDRLVLNEGFDTYWRSAPGHVAGEWVQLTFPVPVVVSTVRLYNPVPGSDIFSNHDNIQVQGATVTLYADSAGTQQVGTTNVGPLTTIAGQGTDVPFANVTARVVRVTINSATGAFNGQPAASLAEVEVIARGTAGP